MDIDDSRPLTGNANSTMYEFEDDGASASATTVDNRPLNVRIGDKVSQRKINYTYTPNI